MPLTYEVTAEPSCKRKRAVEDTQPPSSRMAAEAARARMRSEAIASTVLEKGQTYLQVASVSEGTRRRYEVMVEKVRVFGRKLLPSRDLDTLSAAEMDDLLSKMVNQEYAAGKSSDLAKYLVAAVIWRWPRFRNQLPQARIDMKGFVKRQPPHARLPMPMEVMLALVSVIIDRGERWIALAMVIMFHTYCRPGVLCKVQWKHVIKPVRRGGKGGRGVHTLVLHPREEGVPSKTSAVDETVELGDVASYLWLGDVLEAAMAWAPVGLLGGCTLKEFTAALESAQVQLGLPPSRRYVAYQMRHGGASQDLSSLERSMEAVRKRGAWRTAASVMRYAKSARLNQQLHGLGEGVLEKVLSMAQAAPKKLLESFRRRKQASS
jgi:hypothetical protein